MLEVLARILEPLAKLADFGISWFPHRMVISHEQVAVSYFRGRPPVERNSGVYWYVPALWQFEIFESRPQRIELEVSMGNRVDYLTLSYQIEDAQLWAKAADDTAALLREYTEGSWAAGDQDQTLDDVTEFAMDIGCTIESLTSTGFREGEGLMVHMGGALDVCTPEASAPS